MKSNKKAEDVSDADRDEAYQEMADALEKARKSKRGAFVFADISDKELYIQGFDVREHDMAAMILCITDEYPDVMKKVLIGRLAASLDKSTDED